jgi:hypothetical protein
MSTDKPPDLRGRFIGTRSIQGELARLGYQIAPSTVLAPSTSTDMPHDLAG